MTKIEIFLSNGSYNGFCVSGHSGYDEAGKDIVCAAVSTAVGFAVSLLERVGKDVRVKTDEENAVVSLRLSPTRQSDLIIETFLAQMQDVEAEYGEFLSVAEISR